MRVTETICTVRVSLSLLQDSNIGTNLNMKVNNVKKAERLRLTKYTPSVYFHEIWFVKLRESARDPDRRRVRSELATSNKI